MSEDAQNTADAGDNNTEQAPAPEATFSQQDVDRIVAERLSRERGKFADYDDVKTLAAKATEFEAERAELTQKVAEFEAREQRAALVAEVAAEKGVPADVLAGDTREALEAHADRIKALLPTGAPVVPGAGARPHQAPADPMRETARRLFQTD